MRYSPRSEFPAKRYERLRKCESRLVHCITAATGRKELVRAAERVKEAQILVLKGLRHFLTAPSAVEKINPRRLTKIQDETVAWEAKSVEEVIEMYEGQGTQEPGPAPV